MAGACRLPPRCAARAARQTATKRRRRRRRYHRAERRACAWRKTRTTLFVRTAYGVRRGVVMCFCAFLHGMADKDRRRAENATGDGGGTAAPYHARALLPATCWTRGRCCGAHFLPAFRRLLFAPCLPCLFYLLCCCQRASFLAFSLLPAIACFSFCGQQFSCRCYASGFCLHCCLDGGGGRRRP